MAVFRRRKSSPGPFRHYSKYRSFVREDFAECCAYCLLPEVLANGQENFELDHFRPQSLPQFVSFAHDFYNLYYACHVCNHTKGNRWPGLDLEVDGYGFVDLCAEDFSAHFEEQTDGHWRALSRQGDYSLEKLRLNRSHLVRIRLYLREIAKARDRSPLNWNAPLKEQIQYLLADLLEG